MHLSKSDTALTVRITIGVQRKTKFACFPSFKNLVKEHFWQSLSALTSGLCCSASGQLQHHKNKKSTPALDLHCVVLIDAGGCPSYTEGKG